MKLSRKQRAQVVELLRCAADRCDPLDTIAGFRSTALAIGRPNDSYIASDALLATIGDEGDDWQAACLEVAQRVEDGLWPPKESDFPRAIVHRIGGKP